MNMLELMNRAEGRTVNAANANSVIDGLRSFQEVSTNPEYSLEAPHRFVPYLAQVSHESGGYTYDRELWGPTAAQKKYEGRADLGNTHSGDGFLFRGRTAIQNTGRANARRFTNWCRAYWPDCPDFEADPDQMLADPWEGLCPVWFWNVGNQTGRSLNEYADAGNFEAITRKINGGLNGYDDRCARYVRYGLTVLGYPPTQEGIFAIQRAVGFTGKDVDGIAGQKTRAAIHQSLKALTPAATPVAAIPLPVVNGKISLTKETFIQALEAWGEEIV